MIAPVCESKWQCRLNGLAGTALVVSMVILGWVAFDVLAAGATPEAVKSLGLIMLVYLAPTSLSLVHAGLVRLLGEPRSRFGLVFPLVGAVWGVFMLNTLERL